MTERIIQALFLASASFALGGAAQYIYNNVFPSEKADEHELIRKYLLNNSTLYGKNKPKLWIYMDHERNARDWVGSTFRTSSKLNKGYLYAAITSIVNKCQNDFHICLIDKSVFTHFIPGFNDSTVNDKYKNEYGMALLLYYYGGIIIPPSFICHQSLLPLYKSIQKEDCPFFGENINNRMDAPVHQITTGPSMYFMGAPKNSSIMKMLVDFISTCPSTNHPDTWCERAVQHNICRMIPGEWIGVRDAQGQLVRTDDLLHQTPIDWGENRLGNLFSDKDISKFHAYDKWLTMSEAEMVRDPTNIGKLFRESISIDAELQLE